MQAFNALFATVLLCLLIGSGAAKLDCTLVTFKFNKQKITPKTTLNKH